MNHNTKKWTESTVSGEASIRNAIESLNQSTSQIVLVLDEGGHLLGTVTDGDIRRSLLKGCALEDPVLAIANRAPFVVTSGISDDSVLALMKANRINQIPVVDSLGAVCGLRTRDEMTDICSRPNIMVIMAGGFGKRLRPYTNSCPKPMLEVSGKPILEHIILGAKEEGFSNFVLTLHYLPDVIRDYFGDGERYDVSISYIEEHSPLGTAGALSLMETVTEDPVVVTNGDVLTDVKYGEMLTFHQLNNAAATMAVREHRWQNPYGVVCTEGVSIVGFEEKPISLTHINAGVYVLEPYAFDLLEKNAVCDMPTLFDRLRSDGKSIIAYPMHEAWLDVGCPEDLAFAQSESHQ